MRYCGIVPASGLLQLAMIEELRAPEPPIRLAAAFFEPGSAPQVAAEVGALPEAVIAVGAPLTGAADGQAPRSCDELLRARGVAPVAAHRETAVMAQQLAPFGRFAPHAQAMEGLVEEGAFHDAPVFETNADAVFCALQARRLPAKRHPLGMQMRVEELIASHLLDDGGDPWHRRIEEIDAAAAALCAHRYAVGHASWLGDPAEGVVVLPGASVPERFPAEGVLPRVERLQLPPTR
jgi:predicted nuclease with RNAse H fold